MEFKNQYLTWTEYKSLGGNLQEMPFNLLEFKARKIVDNVTFNRLINLNTQIQEVKCCIYNLINILQNDTETLVSSENIDGYTVNYLDNKESTKRLINIIKNYLIDCKLEDGTPYMYCGVEL